MRIRTRNHLFSVWWYQWLMYFTDLFFVFCGFIVLFWVKIETETTHRTHSISKCCLIVIYWLQIHCNSLEMKRKRKTNMKGEVTFCCCCFFLSFLCFHSLCVIVCFVIVVMKYVSNMMKVYIFRIIGFDDWMKWPLYRAQWMIIRTTQFHTMHENIHYRVFVVRVNTGHAQLVMVALASPSLILPLEQRIYRFSCEEYQVHTI